MARVGSQRRKKKKKKVKHDFHYIHLEGITSRLVSLTRKSSALVVVRQLDFSCNTCR